MRILMVLDKPYPEDLRVEKEAASLTSAGHEVAVLSMGPDGRPESEVLDNGVRVLRLRRPRLWVDAMRALAATWPFSTQSVARAIVSVHARWRFDIVHVHDLYLAGGGVRASRALGVPCMVDLHEHWSGVLDDYRWSSGFPRRLIVGRRRWRRYERRWLPAADGVTVVSEEMSVYYRAIGLDVLVVPNYASSADLSDNDPPCAPLGRPSILYAGGLVPNRGLDTAVRAMPAILAQAEPVTLDIVGDGVDRESLQQLSREIGVDDAVKFRGWVPQSEIAEWIRRATVCINPLRRTRQTDIALSHKLFQYMEGARPVVVTDCPPMKRVIEDADAGIVVADRDVGAFAAAVVRLLTDSEEASRLGRNGRAAVLDRYNWDRGVLPLVQWYTERAEEGR